MPNLDKNFGLLARKLHKKHVISLSKAKQISPFFPYFTLRSYGFRAKKDPIGTFGQCRQKKVFSPEINLDRVVNNVFDLQNDFHEDRLKFRG
jgi:hypothetical protein